MTWFVLILTMTLAVVPKWLSEWAFRLCVLISLGANVVLGLLSRTRRRSASGGWAIGQMVLVFILWVLYLLGEEATKSAISNLALCGSDVSEDEKQVVALWAPFLLLHLGGPDNLTAYALEDNKLEKRTWFEMIGHGLGVGYAIYKYTFRGSHSWVLFAASVIIYVAGATKYIERAYARWKANLDRMQEDTSSLESDSSNKEAIAGSSRCCYRCRSTEARMDELKYRIDSKKGCKLCDRQALLLAQDLFPVWRHAMVDSSVMSTSSRQKASEKILWLEWSSMCKVAEMELSLIYEVLYTKAIVAHNWSGCYYLIRFLSPLCTAAAALLFLLHRHQQQQQGGHRIRGSFVAITYALLVIDFLLDLAWLLRALGSTWAYAYMQTQAPAWLRHQVICPGKWRCLHRFVVRVDPMSWLLCCDPISYRTWSGTIGSYNLLREATNTTTRCSLWPEWLHPKEEIRYLSKLPRDVKKLLFQRVQKILQQAINDTDGKDNKDCYVMEDITTKWGQKAFDLRDRGRLFPELGIDHEEAPKFGKEFEEGVLAWHIATCIVLPYIRRQHQKRGPLPARSQLHAKAIAVMSEYMMFLVAVRRDMLPGLVLHSLYKVTRETLVVIWDKHVNILSPEENREAANNEEKLAMILRRISRVEPKEGSWIRFEGTEGTELLCDAVALFRSLMLAGDTQADRKRRKISFQPGKRRVKRRTPVPVPELLEFIFNVWVDKLVYAAVQCSRESHAKQLSAGGDLTTVLWMVIQHAGPFRFRMGELKPIYIPRYRLRGIKSLFFDEAEEDDDEVEDSHYEAETEDSDDEDTKEYNTPIKYATLS